MAEIIAITNQKGGVGKTTTALNLGAAFAQMGSRVLFVDMDPQCSLTYALGGELGEPNVAEVLLGSRTAQDTIRRLEDGDLLAADPSLSGMDLTLNQTGKEFRLREALGPILSQYDFILLDSPPTLGVLTVNILTAASSVVVPALADIFSLQGVGQLYTTIQAVQTYCNPGLKLQGILLTRHTERFVLSREMRQMLEDTAQQLNTRVYRTAIRESVALREAQAARESIFRYAPRSRQAADYMAFAQEYLSIAVGE